MNERRTMTETVKQLAREAGFAAVGIAPVGAAAREDLLRRWLERGWHGEMDYMARHVEKRLSPARLMEGARSVVCLAVGYASEGGGQLVARYARGRDYHRVLKKRCFALMDRVREIAPGFEGRAFVDSGPLSERALAAAAGLGWIGRNGCLIVPGLGSYVLLAEIACNLPLRPDAPLRRACAGCDVCVKLCPTGAIAEPPLVDARLCISYLTVEHRGAIDRELWPKMGCRVVGCDACQEACPHNRDIPGGDDELTGGQALGGATLADILAWEPADWDAATRGSAARRATYEMFLRNAILAAGNSDDALLREPLRRLARYVPAYAEMVEWAVGRLA